jgi:hypothetical protein
MNDPRILFDKLKDLRRRVVAGEQVSDEELREGIRLLHEYRSNSHTTLESHAKKVAKASAKASAKAGDKQKAMNLLGDLL